MRWTAINLIMLAVAGIACRIGGSSPSPVIGPENAARIEQVLRLEGDADDSARSFTFSPDGQLIALGRSNGSVQLWDAKTGRLILSLDGHTLEVIKLLFSPDGRLLASGDPWTAYLWDVEEGKPLFKTDHLDSICGLAFSPDGEMLATGGGGSTELWDVGTGQWLQNLGEGSCFSLAFSPDGRVLAKGTGTGVQIWDVGSGELLNTLVSKFRQMLVTSLAFSPDGSALASSGLGGLSGGNGWLSDDMFVLWGFDRGDERIRMEGTLEIGEVTFSPDGALLAMGRETVWLWEVESGRLLRTLEGHRYGQSGLAFSPDGRMLATSGDDHTVRLWDVESGMLVHALEGEGFAFSPDGRTLALGGDDGTVRLWGVAP